MADAKEIWEKRYSTGGTVCTEELVQDEPVDYTQHSFLWQHSIAARLTGDLNGNPMTVIGEKFLKPAADRILAIGSGMAFTEEAIVKAGYFKHVIAFELSEAAVDAANARLKQIGLSDAIEMRAGNVLEANLADASFDVVFVQAAIHHFFNIEEMFKFMHRVLKPGGLLIFDEYIGPDMHQYDPVVIAISNEVNNCLAERYRRDNLRAGEVRPEVPFATMEWMLQMDPLKVYSRIADYAAHREVVRYCLPRRVRRLDYAPVMGCNSCRTSNFRIQQTRRSLG